MSKHWASAAAAVVVITALAGCSSGDGDPAEVPVDAPDPVVTASAAPTAAPLTFAMPATCAELVPTARIARFEGQGLVLLGGPGGRYGTDYLGEPSPEERLGGITCIWGHADSEVSSITLSAAPLAPSSRPGIVEGFVADGLNEGELDDASTFGMQGDTELSPAVYNVLRNESWISVISTVGGPAFYDEAVLVADEVATTVYK